MTRSQRSNRNRGAVVEKSNREHREVHREMQQDRPIVVPAGSLPDHPPPAPELVLDYRAREQFCGFHARAARFACIVTHRRAGKTVACINELQHAAIACARLRGRFAYLAPYLKQYGDVGLSARRRRAIPR